MKTVLVSGASGIVGYGVLKSLRASLKSCILVGTTIYGDSIAPAFCDVFERSPRTSDPLYMEWLCEVLKRHKVDMAIPGIHDDMIAWNQFRHEISKTGVHLLLNNPDLIDLCADKWSFYETLKCKDLKYLIESRNAGGFDAIRDAFGLPFILKPRRGFGSKGILIIESEAQFMENTEVMGSVLMAQPIVGDNESEYTASAFFDADSKLCCWMSLRRKLSKDGYTEKAEVSNPPKIDEAIRQFGDLLKPVGPTNFQFRVEKGELKLLEINPRISSATSIRTAFGYNESAMAVEYFLNGETPVQPRIRRGSAVRYTEDYIFYENDETRQS